MSEIELGASGDVTETAASADPSASPTAGGTSADSTGNAAEAPDVGTPTETSRQRDAQGRFVAAGVATTSEEGAAGAAPEQQSQPGAETAEAAAPVGAEAAPAPALGTPWTVSAIGQTFNVTGATTDAEGRLMVAPEGVDQIHAYIGKGIKYDAERGQLRQAQAEASLGTARTRAVLERFDALMQLSDDDFVNAALQFKADLPGLARQGDLDARERQLALREQMQRPDADEAMAETNRAAEAGLRESVTEMRQEPWAKGLDDKDWQAITAKVEKYATSFFVVEDGTLYLNENLVRAEAQERAELKRGAAVVKAKAAEAAAFNAARQPQAPAATGVKGAPATPAKPAAKKPPTNWDEWNQATGLL